MPSAKSATRTAVHNLNAYEHYCGRHQSQSRLRDKGRFETLTSASWLNLVERWFAALTEKQILRGVFRSTRELEDAIMRYLESANEHPKPFIWTKTADQILANIARFCNRISNSGH